MGFLKGLLIIGVGLGLLYWYTTRFDKIGGFYDNIGIFGIILVMGFDAMLERTGPSSRSSLPAAERVLRQDYFERTGGPGGRLK